MPDLKHPKKRILKYLLPIACCVLSFVLGGFAMAVWERKNAAPAADTKAPAKIGPSDITPPADTGQLDDITSPSNGNLPDDTADYTLTPSPHPTEIPMPSLSPHPAETKASAATPGATMPPATTTPAGTTMPPSATTPAGITMPPAATPAATPTAAQAAATPKPSAALESTKEATPAPTVTPVPSKKPSSNNPSKAPSSGGQPSEKEDSAKSGFSVSSNGQLQVKGTQLVNQSGSPVVLRGVSTAGIAWFPNFATKAFMKTLKDEWGISVFRIAMYSYEGSDSYVNNPEWNKSKVCSLIDAAMELDLYVIVDWHILADGNPQTYQAQATEFFDYISSAYPQVPNILYEICNEPNGNASWENNIKPYAQAVIPVIRQHSPDAIIIVGTPTWSQDVDAAAASPLEEDNVMYALHFYAGTHKEWLRSRASDALGKGLPIFVSEWGTTDASGNGNVDTASSDEWLEFLESNQISWCNWSLCNKAESSALLLPSAGDSGSIPDSAISTSGQYVKKKLKEYGGGGMPAVTPDTKEQDLEHPSHTPAAPTPSPSPGPTAAQAPDAPQTPADSSGLLLLSYNENRTAISNTISPRIQLQNNTGGEVSLEHITILYYYTPESDAAQKLWCDYADINGSAYRAITASVKGIYRSGAKSCMEISFDSTAGCLSPGDTATLQLRITNEDWSDYDQSNDSSFLPSSGSWQENPALDLILQE